MRRLIDMKSALDKHAELWVGLIAVALLIALIVIWFVSSAGLEAIRDYGLLFAAILAFPLGFWRSRVAERQASAAQRQVSATQEQLRTAQLQAEAAQRQADTAQQNLLNERYRQGAEMLGSEVLAVRLGGIYALQRLAHEYPQQYHIQIMQMFCAFVLSPTPDAEQAEVRRRQETRARIRSLSQMDIEDARRIGMRDPYFVRHLVIEDALREDVQAVVTAIGARSKTARDLERAVGFKLNLDGANLSGALLHGSDLSGVSLNGADLRRVSFFGADLANAHLNQANLSGAMIMGADLSGAEISDAILSGASLSWDALYRQWETKGFTRDQFDAALDSGGWRRSVDGLTQAQLDEARADPNNPPKLDGVLDAKTGRQLVWRGKPLDAS